MPQKLEIWIPLREIWAGSWAKRKKENQLRSTDELGQPRVVAVLGVGDPGVYRDT